MCVKHCKGETIWNEAKFGSILFRFVLTLCVCVCARICVCVYLEINTDSGNEVTVKERVVLKSD